MTWGVNVNASVRTTIAIRHFPAFDPALRAALMITALRRCRVFDIALKAVPMITAPRLAQSLPAERPKANAGHVTT